jgi:hypothetical protein
MPIDPNEAEIIRDRRITVLETRFDTILPTLATKTDLAELKGEVFVKLAETKAELKAEIRAESARLTKWMASMFVTIILGFGGMALTMMSLLRH